MTGCTKVSAGCKHCYAEALADRFWGGRNFADVRFHPQRLEQPLRWRKPRRIFVNSMSDVFHERLPDESIDKIFAVMAEAQWHVYLILTKRPERMRQYLSAGNGRVLENLWLGASCEDQAAADLRIPLLLRTPAAMRFISVEPLLTEIDLNKAGAEAGPALDLVIVGGESGPRARPCEIAWIRSIVAQCAAAGVPCFVKQLGSRPVLNGRVAILRDRKGADPSEWPPFGIHDGLPGSRFIGRQLSARLD